MSIKEGDFIGLTDDEIVTACDNVSKSVMSTLEVANAKEAEIATLYWGTNVNAEEAESMAREMRNQYPSLEIEVIQGAQPHYHYIIALE